ncbi:MAG: hypothetical protein HKN59_04500 [Gammaproteobacteria bacterium]|nr:hypothetical protein [Gammaproteobacteria bacterium]
MQEVREARQGRGALRAGRRITVPSLFLCLGLAAGSSALTIGDMQVRSTLGQPFSGVVRVEAAAGEVIRRECFSLGSDAGAMPGVPIVNGVRFVLESTPGASYLRLLGQTPLKEPLAQVVLQVSCPGLPRLTKSFMLLIDPASLARPPEPLPALLDADPRQVGQVSARGQQVVGDIPPGSRYVVRSGDTLSGVAARINGRPPYSVWPLAQQIRERNPAAFLNGRADQLIAGASINIPDLNGAGADLDVGLLRATLPGQQSGTRTESTASSNAQLEVGAAANQPQDDRVAGGRSVDRLFDTPIFVGEPVANTDLEYLVLTPVLSRLSRDRIAQRSSEPAQSEPAPDEPVASTPAITPPAPTAEQPATDAVGYVHLLYWALGILLLLLAAAGGLFYARKLKSRDVEQDNESPWELEDDGELPELPEVDASERPPGMVYDDFLGTFVSAEPIFEVTESRADTPTVDDPEKNVMTHLMPTVDDSGERPPAIDEAESEPFRDIDKTAGSSNYRRNDENDISVTTLEENDDNVTEEGWVELDFEATQILEQDYLAEYAAKLKDKVRPVEDEVTDIAEADDETTTMDELEIDEEPLLMAHEMLTAPDEPDEDSLALAEDTGDGTEEEEPIVLVEPDEDLTAALAAAPDKGDDNVVNIAEGKNKSSKPDGDTAQPGERKKS